MNLVGAQVLACRKVLRITRATMAGRIAKISGGAWRPGTSEIAKIEREKRTLLTTELLIISEVLETTPHDLLGGTGWSQVIKKLVEAGGLAATKDS